MAKEALLKEPLSTDVDRLDEIFGEKLVTEHAKVDAHQIRPRLLLGSASAAMDPDQVHEYRITHVVNCLHTSCERFSKKKHQVLPEPQYPRLVAAYAEHKQTPVTYLEYLSLDLQDTPDQIIGDIFPITTAWIESKLNADPRNVVLVHCMAGVSRSTSVLMAYIMWKESLTAARAMREVQSLRVIANPNSGFRAQLLTWQHQLETERAEKGLAALKRVDEVTWPHLNS